MSIVHALDALEAQEPIAGEPVAAARPTLWESQTASACAASSLDAERRGRLVRLLAGSQMGVSVAAAVACFALVPAEAPGLLSTLALATVGMGLSYLAASRHMLRTAALGIAGTQLFAPAIVLASTSTTGGVMGLAAWLSLAVLTANATLGGRAGVAVGASAALEVAGLSWGRHHPMAITEAALFLFSATIASVAYSRHQAGIEAARQDQLASRNRELEVARAFLEDRVNERTREVMERVEEVERAHASLTENQALLLRTEKMAAVGRLTAGFAHELATPLSACLAALDVQCELLREYARSIGDPGVTDEDHRAIAADMGVAQQTMASATGRAVTFVRQIRAHTRDPGKERPQQFDLGRLAAECADLLQYLARSARVELRVEAPAERIELTGLPTRLNQALTNLLQNAIDATTERGAGQVVVKVGQTAGEAWLRVEDDGPGIAPEVLPHIFEPLFTTKPYGKGTGLGLSIVHEVVTSDFRGEIAVEARALGGTAFVLRLPIEPSGGHHGT